MINTRRERALLVWAVLLASLPLLGGCATIFAPSTRDVGIITDPVGARISVNGEPVGVGPKRVRVPNDEPLTLVAELADHSTVVVNL